MDTDLTNLTAEQLIEAYAAAKTRLDSYEAEYKASTVSIKTAMTVIAEELRGRLPEAEAKPATKNGTKLTKLTTGAGEVAAVHKDGLRLSSTSEFRDWVLEDPQARLQYVSLSASKTECLKKIHAGETIPGTVYRTWVETRVTPKKKSVTYTK